MPSPGFSTLLTISGQGLAPYSARGLTQTLAPIDQQSNTKRTVNGVLKDISFDNFKKYTTNISCNDLEAPALDGVWSGMIITVDCSAELAYLTADESVSHPTRPAVDGSTRVEGDYTYFRPILTMMITGWTGSHVEWGGNVSWSLTAEEV